MSTIIDKCISFIESKDASYLAKEGLMVYYASTTGRQSDCTWHKLSLEEAIRILRATKLNTAQGKELSKDHFISAFQELDRVYEFAVKSRHDVSEGIFNYLAHANNSIGESIMELIVNELEKYKYDAVNLIEITRLYHLCHEKLRITSVDIKEMRQNLYKCFEASGYIIKTGSRRVLVGGRKTTVAIKPSARPAQVESFEHHMDGMAERIYQELR